jgi:predicted nuclease of predicted toxin-antitoxin system
MRLLLDENLDWRLRRDLLDHQVESVPLIGWAGIENGELLRKAVEAEFDVLVTMDSNMVHQQNMRQNAIAVVAITGAIESTGRHSSADAGATRVAITRQARHRDVSS